MEPILKVSNLNITLPNGTNIITDVSFEIRSGEVVALAGDNGAGKSTILRAIMREDASKKTISGSISFCGGRNILEMSESELQDFRSKVAYVSQRDDYANIGKRVNVFDVMMDSAHFYSKRTLTKRI